MSANREPQLSQQWWDEHRPPDLRDNALSKALARLEKSLAAQQAKSDDPEAIDNCLAALDEVAEAADKTARLCKKHQEVVDALDEFDELVQEQSSRLQQRKDELAAAKDDVPDDDEENRALKGKLFDKDRLGKMMRMLKNGSKEFKFGFGLNTGDPEASRLVLDRKGMPEKLLKALKRTGEFSERQLTFGYASADPQDNKTLVFRLESGAGEPPQIEKLGRKFLRSDKSLRFRKLKIVAPDGKLIAETDVGPNANRVS